MDAFQQNTLDKSLILTMYQLKLKTKLNYIFTPPIDIHIIHKRVVPKEDFINLKMMPGFKVKWYLNAYVPSNAFFSNGGDNKAFVRQVFQV